MNDELILFIGIAAVIYYIYQSNESEESSNFIQDSDVDVKTTIRELSEFAPHKDGKSISGYTEVMIQKQLHTFLKSRFQHVNREQGLEAINGAKIDFDLGRGKVGLEIKLAKSLFKTATLQRLVGQLNDYTESKYSDDNLIVVVFGTQEEECERVMLGKIKDRIKENGATYLFIKIPEN
jgi:hypothetical protein